MKLILYHVLHSLWLFFAVSINANENIVSNNFHNLIHQQLKNISPYGNNYFSIVRQKREDATYASNFGGPVASQSQHAMVPVSHGSNSKAVMSSCTQHKSKNETLLEKLRKMYPNTFDRRGRVKQNKAIKEFRKFMVKYNKTYVSRSDLDKATTFFKTNFQTLVKIAETRRTDEDASFILTKFSDLTFDLFKKQHTGAITSIDDVIKADISVVNKKYCSKLSWNNMNVIPNVRQQDKCGSCYAMTTADLISAQYSIDKKMWNNNHQLSPQYMIDCVPSPATYKCNGGRPVKVFDHLSKCNNCRIPTESCYRYVDKAGTCQSSARCAEAPPIKVKWGKMVDVSGSHEKELMAALLHYGPVIAILGVSQSWQMYDGKGILRSYQCSEEPNHAVLITGYDYTGCVPYYNVKNTWGTNWGNKGYIKLEAGKNACGVAKSVVLVCLSDDCPSSDHLKHITSKANYPSC